MTFSVRYDATHLAAILAHEGPVDEPEIRASRVELKTVANAEGAAGAVIDILDAQIEATPVDIIENVEALTRDLKPGTRLAFVAREADQQTVSMIVTTVAHSSGLRVEYFPSLDGALEWIRAYAA
ncbi:hypothetical protein [Maricaulis sp.]|jgi:hypothetical protein|uniref:hypothetical protein n=1 Tax=Maricaulis sp. TaxID=1486257 RepID=UPI00260BDE41|nr:hypothetical protein [Maricaulis sp.]